jgi:hypothetical protein
MEGYYQYVNNGSCYSKRVPLKRGQLIKRMVRTIRREPEKRQLNSRPITRALMFHLLDHCRTYI